MIKDIFAGYEKYVKPEMEPVEVKNDESKLFELEEDKQVDEVETSKILTGLSDDDVVKIATKLSELMKKGDDA